MNHPTLTYSIELPKDVEQILEVDFWVYTHLTAQLLQPVTEAVKFTSPVSVFIEKGTACLASHTVQIDNYYKDNEKDLFVVIDNSKIKSLKSPGSLFTFKVKADETLAEASQIVLKDVKFNGGQYFDVNVDVTKGTSTGINEAKAEEADNAPVFNLGGQRASKNGKGILVKKGKKYVQTR